MPSTGDLVKTLLHNRCSTRLLARDFSLGSPSADVYFHRVFRVQFWSLRFEHVALSHLIHLPAPTFCALRLNWTGTPRVDFSASVHVISDRAFETGRS